MQGKSWDRIPLLLLRWTQKTRTLLNPWKTEDKIPSRGVGTELSAAPRGRMSPGSPPAQGHLNVCGMCHVYRAGHGTGQRLWSWTGCPGKPGGNTEAAWLLQGQHVPGRGTGWGSRDPKRCSRLVKIHLVFGKGQRNVAHKQMHTHL